MKKSSITKLFFLCASLTLSLHSLPTFALDDIPRAYQSPVDISAENFKVVATQPSIYFYNMNVATVTDTRSNFNQINGHEDLGALKSTIGGSKPYIYVGQPEGVAGGVRYTLQQFHFHTPSEHELNATKTAMEVHFVFYRDDPSPCFTRGQSLNPVLVIGAWIRPGTTNSELGKIFNSPLNSATTEKYLVGGAADSNVTASTGAYSGTFDITKVLPTTGVSQPNILNVSNISINGADLRNEKRLSGSFYKYSGSLTAPLNAESLCAGTTTPLSVDDQVLLDTFPEIVDFNILAQPITMSDAQIRNFTTYVKSYSPEIGNAREVQAYDYVQGINTYKRAIGTSNALSTTRFPSSDITRYGF